MINFSTESFMKVGALSDLNLRVVTNAAFQP